MSRRTLALSILVAAWWVLGGLPGFSADETTIHSWTPRMMGTPAESPGSSPSEVKLVRASYEVDVLGSMAVGVLVQEFLNEGENDLLVTYPAQAPVGLHVDSLELDVAGRVHELSATPGEGARKPGGRQSRSAPQPKKVEPVLLEAGETATVRSGFQMVLPLSDGRFRVRLPAVTAALGAANEEAPAEGAATAVTGGITINVYHDEPLAHAESSTHDVFVAYEGDRSVVELVEGEVPSREFGLDFAMGVEDDASLLGYIGPEKDGIRDVVVVFTPPMKPRDETIRPKQVLFVLDTSGSMAKAKIEEARRALATCLEKLTPNDQLNIVRFDSGFKMWNEGPVEASEGALLDARAWLDDTRAGGGTQLLPALGATLEQADAPEHHRMIIVLSDGAIRDEDPVLALLEAELGDGRLFVVGIGADVRQETILRLAEYGRGTAAFASDPEGLDAALANLFDSVSRPLAWDLQIDWGSAEVKSIEPTRLPDLYAGRPVTVRARIAGEVPGSLSIGASTTNGERVFTTDLPTVGEGGPRKLPGPARREAPAKKSRTKR